MQTVLNRFFLFIILLYCGLNLSSQDVKDFNDGPYIEIRDHNVLLRWIEKGERRDSLVDLEIATYFERPGLPIVDLQNLTFKKDSFQRYKNVSKFAAISDLHGQYDLFLDILKAQNIISDSLKWNYGDGHLVIVGDIFDRGDKVTEILWFLFNLEKQAEKENGKIHILLGNHELMVLHNDLRYINLKYRYTSGVHEEAYADFFNSKSVLGKWLRSKNITTVINDVGFVHGGFSPQVIEKEKSLATINKVFKENIIDSINGQQDEFISLLNFENGPLWYRGYADPSGFDLKTANIILDALRLNHLVVGHTSMPRIVSIHDNKIILVDSSIKFGKTGEILFFEANEYYRGLLSGEAIKMSKSKQSEESQSPFEYVLGLGETDLLIELRTDVSNLLGKNKEKKEYQSGQLVAYHNKEYNRTWDIRIRSSGNMRKQVCRLPPIKIDFSKSTLDYLGFTKNDKLKLLIPCSKGKKFQNKLLQEFVIYKMFSQINEWGLKNHLVDVRLIQDDKIKYDVTGFFLEDDKDFEHRTGATLVEKGILRRQSLNRTSYLKMIFFQYMILNTDFAVFNRHNLKMFVLPGEIVPRVIPYDFDYAGIVDQDYAIPHPSLNLHSVRIPLFQGKDITKEEVFEMKELFNQKRKGIERIIKDSRLHKKGKKAMLKDVKRFYKELNNEKKWESIFISK